MSAPLATPIPLTTEDQRRTRRPRVLLTGQLVFGENALTVGCVIRDLTENGARLKLSGPAVLPAQLTLIEMATGKAHACEVSWRRLPEIGVRFVSSQDLETVRTTPALERLRRLWLDARPR